MSAWRNKTQGTRERLYAIGSNPRESALLHRLTTVQSEILCRAQPNLAVTPVGNSLSGT